MKALMQDGMFLEMLRQSDMSETEIEEALDSIDAEAGEERLRMQRDALKRASADAARESFEF